MAIHIRPTEFGLFEVCAVCGAALGEVDQKMERSFRSTFDTLAVSLPMGFEGVSIVSLGALARR